MWITTGLSLEEAAEYRVVGVFDLKIKQGVENIAQRGIDGLHVRLGQLTIENNLLPVP